jgi:hypothetical protein
MQEWWIRGAAVQTAGLSNRWSSAILQVAAISSPSKAAMEGQRDEVDQRVRGPLRLREQPGSADDAVI